MSGRWGRRLGIPAACVAALEIVCRAGLVAPTDLVPPTVMVRAMADALGQRATLRDFGLTLGSVAASAVIAAVLGIAAGIVLHALPRLRRACEPFIASYYALPLFALYPVLVVIFGIGPTPIIFTGVLYAAMSVLIGTLSGLDHIPRVFRKAAKVHRLGLTATIVRLYIPASAAEILGGITLSISYAFVAVIASEFLLAPAGIGHAIADAYTTFQIERMYGLMLALALLVALINSGLRVLRARLGPVAT
jgi:NitT/TauT family transport system permease protein